jgi:hypothetical protein
MRLARTPHPADYREQMRQVLARLVEVAREVYPLREDLADPQVRFCDAVQTVLYAFDQFNRHAVAEGLGLSDLELLTLLVGFEMGFEMGRYEGMEERGEDYG